MSALPLNAKTDSLEQPIEPTRQWTASGRAAYGWLLLPKTQTERAPPSVVCQHGLKGVRRMPPTRKSTARTIASLQATNRASHPRAERTSKTFPHTEPTRWAIAFSSSCRNIRSFLAGQLPMVDSDRIAFTAVVRQQDNDACNAGGRILLSICSAGFNEWI